MPTQQGQPVLDGTDGMAIDELGAAAVVLASVPDLIRPSADNIAHPTMTSPPPTVPEQTAPARERTPYAAVPNGQIMLRMEGAPANGAILKAGSRLPLTVYIRGPAADCELLLELISVLSETDGPAIFSTTSSVRAGPGDLRVADFRPFPAAGFATGTYILRTSLRPRNTASSRILATSESPAFFVR